MKTYEITVCFADCNNQDFSSKLTFADNEEQDKIYETVFDSAREELDNAQRILERQFDKDLKKIIISKKSIMNKIDEEVENLCKSVKTYDDIYCDYCNILEPKIKEVENEIIKGAKECAEGYAYISICDEDDNELTDEGMEFQYFFDEYADLDTYSDFHASRNWNRVSPSYEELEYWEECLWNQVKA